MSEKSSIVDRIPVAGIVLADDGEDPGVTWCCGDGTWSARARASSMTASMPTAWLARTVPSPSYAAHGTLS